MNFLSGLALIAVGIAIWVAAISALIAWLAFCFGTVIIGILMLIFVPQLLLMPLAIGVPGTGMLALGIEKLRSKG